MQTINSPTLFDIPVGQKLHIRSNDLFTAAVLPRNTDQNMMMNMLENAAPTNSYTSLNMPTSESVCVVKPYNNSPINIETSYMPSHSGSRSMINYGMNYGMRNGMNYGMRNGMNYGMRNGMNYGRFFREDPAPVTPQPVKPATFMEKLREWWGKIPSWAKWLAGALLIAMIVVMGFMLYRKYGGNMMMRSNTPRMNTGMRQGLTFF